jgi:hypothetical protein
VRDIPGENFTAAVLRAKRIAFEEMENESLDSHAFGNSSSESDD